MDTRDNQFKYMDNVSDEEKKFLIPFDIGEEVQIKNYRFRVSKVDVDANFLILEPIGSSSTQPLGLKTIRSDAEVSFQKEIDKMKAKGGLGV